MAQRADILPVLSLEKHIMAPLTDILSEKVVRKVRHGVDDGQIASICLLKSPSWV